MSYLDYNDPYKPNNNKPAKPKKGYGGGNYNATGSDNYQRFLEYLEQSGQAQAFRRKISRIATTPLNSSDSGS